MCYPARPTVHAPCVAIGINRCLAARPRADFPRIFRGGKLVGQPAGECARPAIDTSNGSQPTLNFYQGTSGDKALLDFFSYNPISSSYPRAGIVNLNTKNRPVLAAIIKGAVSTENPNATVGQTAANNAATAVVNTTTAQQALTRADAARLAGMAGGQIGASEEQKEAIARALAEVGQTRTWNVLIDVIAQTGRYSPDATDINQSNKFTVEGAKRYWLHIALGRDLNDDGTVDVLGTQLEQVID